MLQIFLNFDKKKAFARLAAILLLVNCQTPGLLSNSRIADFYLGRIYGIIDRINFRLILMGKS